MIRNKTGSNYKIHEVDSRSELKELCKETQATVLDFDIEGGRKFYLIEFQYNNIERVYGIASGGHGTEPTVTEIEEQEKLVISSDNFVYMIDLDNQGSIKRIACDSLVYDVFFVQNNSILVICELGVSCLSLDGSQIWRYDCDVINDFTLRDSHVEILIDNARTMISLKDGSLI